MYFLLLNNKESESDILLEILSVKDIINHLKIDKMTAYRLIKDKQIKAVNIGTEKRPKYRILKDDYDNFLKGETDNE